MNTVARDLQSDSLILPEPLKPSASHFIDIENFLASALDNRNNGFSSARGFSVDATQFSGVSPWGRSVMYTITIINPSWPTTAGEPAMDSGLSSIHAWTRWFETTNAALRAAPTMERPTGDRSASAKLRVQRIAEVQAIFGFSTSEMADVLRITRQGLYKWLDASKVVKLHEASKERIALLANIAEQWRARTTSPLADVSDEPLGRGATILTLLTAELVDEAAVASAFEDLLARLQTKAPSLTRRMADAGFKRRPSLRSTVDEDE